MTVVTEFGTREGTPPTPEELQAQGVATINRVREFFEGVDLTTKGTHKNGLVDVTVFPDRYGGYWHARAAVNGLVAAEIDTYDSELGIAPYYQYYNPREPIPRAMYWLKGCDRHNTELKALIVEHDAGMILMTATSDSRVKHEIGNTPRQSDYGVRHLPHLPRPIEKAVLQELGVKI